MYENRYALVIVFLIASVVIYMFISRSKSDIVITDPLEADKATFTALKNAGTDFSKEHLVDFLFIGEGGLETVRATLENKGFYAAERQSPGQLLMHKKMILELALMQSLTVELDRLAKSTNTDYDGWGATVVK